MAKSLTLVSFDLCPYVQRAAIVLAEKGVRFERVDIDLSDKPDWFKAISPLGKVPLLRIGDMVLFESAAIVEYLDEVYGRPLHPQDPIQKARHRAWMEFGSSVLSNIWIIETTPDLIAFRTKIAALTEKFARIENELGAHPYFAEKGFSLVDAVFAPVFRYFDVFDTIGDFGVFATAVKVRAWRRALSERPSVRSAVVADYPDRLLAFLRRHNGHIASLIR